MPLLSTVIQQAGKKKSLLITAGIVLGTAATAAAITAPTGPTDFAWDVYDIGVNKILNGPIGFVAGAGAMVAGAVAAIQQKLALASMAIIGGAVLLNADSMVTSLGLVF
ncbi:MAG: hypothetical protein ACOZF0_12875 [Thermodesulfobacteriota bacterium]